MNGNTRWAQHANSTPATVSGGQSLAVGDANRFAVKRCVAVSNAAGVDVRPFRRCMIVDRWAPAAVWAVDVFLARGKQPMGR
jgi:hypothetical protein